MSGHSKWATIKRKKAKLDQKRGKVFTKISKEISVAARSGGDPEGNARLRLLIDKAKAANMPHDNIMRAIKKGTGEIEGAQYESAVYEGYGPAGSAVMVETLSDNKNRTIADVRHVFTKMGGNIAEGGAVSWMFQHVGVIELSADNLNADEVLEKLIDYAIEDVSLRETQIVITCEKTELDAIRKACEGFGWKVESAEMEWIAKDHISITDSEQEEKAYKFLEALEELDDVQNVYTNIG